MGPCARGLVRLVAALLAAASSLPVLARVDACTAAGCQRVSGQPASPGPTLSLRYVANAGVLLSVGGTDVLIDAPIREGIPPYATSGPLEREALERARPPYDRVAAILITHWHDDHFDAEAVAAHMRENERSVLVSSPEVVERVRAVSPRIPDGRLRAVLPAPGTSEPIRIGALPIRVLRIRHNPARRLPEQHVGFLIGEPTAVLHTGDADPAADNFTLLRGLPAVDLALVPFWYVQSDASYRFVREALAPRRIAALHVPPADAAQVRAAFVAVRRPAVLLSEPGTAVALTP